jgi:hypothetical protein
LQFPIAAAGGVLDEQSAVLALGVRNFGGGVELGGQLPGVKTQRSQAVERSPAKRDARAAVPFQAGSGLAAKPPERTNACTRRVDGGPG